LATPSSLDSLLNVITSEKSVVLKSVYTNFNIAFANWLNEKLATDGHGVCIDGDSQLLEFAQRMCRSSFVICGSGAQFVVAIVLFKNIEEGLHVKATTTIHILPHRASMQSTGGTTLTYVVRRVSSNVYTITRSSKSLAENYIVRVFECTLSDYQLPREVVEIYTALREVVEIAGGSVKAHDFLKHLVKVKGLDREKALNAIRCAVQLKLVEYSNGYLTPL